MKTHKYQHGVIPQISGIIALQIIDDVPDDIVQHSDHRRFFPSILFGNAVIEHLDDIFRGLQGTMDRLEGQIDEERVFLLFLDVFGQQPHGLVPEQIG